MLAASAGGTSGPSQVCRFGIFALRDDGSWGERDAAGEDVAGAYGRIARALREPDDEALRGALVRAFDRE